MSDKQRPLRILHVSALQLWAMKGNAGMCCLIETLRGHRRAGHEVTVVIPAYDLWDNDIHSRPVPGQPEFEVYAAPCSWLPVMKGLRSTILRWTARRGLPYLLTWISSLITWALLTVSLVRTAMRLVYGSKRSFDLVYAHCEYAAPAGYLIRLLFGIPNVTRLYGTFVADLMRRPLVWLRYPIAAGGFLIPHNLLICANDGTRGDEVGRKFRLDLGKFRFWQDGVDRPSAKPGRGREWLIRRMPGNIRRESKWVLSCSRLDYWKRIDRLVRAIGHARQVGSDCQFLVAGDGAEKDRLIALVEELGLKDAVVWLGPVPHEEVWELMSSSDIFVIANDVTNRCNPLFEAMRTGLPVVSIRDASTKDLLVDGENACLADREDERGLGECIARVSLNPDLARQMRQAQQRRDAMLWTWKERMTVEVQDLEDLVKAHRRRGRVSCAGVAGRCRRRGRS